MSGNQITDLTPLARLIPLKSPRLDGNQLDLTLGAPAMRIINLFQDRRAEVTYEPQN